MQTQKAKILKCSADKFRTARGMLSIISCAANDLKLP